MPTSVPTTLPTFAPSHTPTEPPTTLAPSTDRPSFAPSRAPTEIPTEVPSFVPTFVPSVAPTETPQDSKTSSPNTGMPSLAPSHAPTPAPSDPPTPVPTRVPTLVPTEVPVTLSATTRAPSFAPSQMPTSVPTTLPTFAPSHTPTEPPTTLAPSTDRPSFAPSRAPTEIPTEVPSFVPTFVPSVAPTERQTAYPSDLPTLAPSYTPTAHPTFLQVVTSKQPWASVSMLAADTRAKFYFGVMDAFNNKTALSNRKDLASRPYTFDLDNGVFDIVEMGKVKRSNVPYSNASRLEIRIAEDGTTTYLKDDLHVYTSTARASGVFRAFFVLASPGLCARNVQWHRSATSKQLFQDGQMVQLLSQTAHTPVAQAAGIAWKPGMSTSYNQHLYSKLGMFARTDRDVEELLEGM